MKRFPGYLIVAAVLVSAVPVFAHGSRLGSGPRIVHDVSSLDRKETVNGLNKDIDQDNKRLTEDERQLIDLEMRAAEAKSGKASPLSTEQLRELRELRNRIGNLDKDIGRDTQQLTKDQPKLRVWEDERSAP